MGLLDGLFATPSDQALWALGSGLFGVRKGNEGRALMGAMGAYNDAQQEQRRNKLTDAQIARMEREANDPQIFGKLDPSDFTPESLAIFQATKNYGDLKLNPRNSKLPSAVLEYEYLSGLKTPEERNNFWGIKRGPTVKDIGGVPSQIAPGGVTPLSTLDKEAEAKARIAGEKKRSEATGAAAGQADVDLPAAEARLPVLEKQVKSLLAHPGRKLATGVLGVLPPIPGRPEADFVSRLEQLKAGAFLQAYETLKGGGQITEIEGEKATAAMNRMSRTTSDKEFEAAAQDFLDAYKAGITKLKSKRAQFPSGYMNPQEQAGARFSNPIPGDKVNPVPGGFKILGVE